MCRDGYASENERIHKRRRLDVLRGELARVERRLADKRYPVTLGTARLLNTRHHLGTAGLTEPQWRQRWESKRAFFGAIGNTGKAGGNPCLTLTVDDAGALRLTVSIPRPVAERLGVGSRVRLANPVPWRFCGAELRGRVAQRTSVRLDVEFARDRRGRDVVFLRSSWQRPAGERVSLEAARAGGVVGVDFNADHLAAWRLDAAGNPVGASLRVPLEVARQPAKVRDQRLRAALTGVIEHAAATGASAIAVEDLGFSDEEKSRESYGRRKGFRRLVSGFATTQLRERLPRMADKHDLAVIAVDPRYTSAHGGRTWSAVLSSPTAVVTRHEGAAVAIGRRALAHRLTARLTGQPRQRSVPHQSDGSTASSPRTGQAGQGRAPAAAARRCAAHPGRNRGDATLAHVRRPPGQAADLAGVDPADITRGSPQAGHRFAGAPPSR